MQDLHTGEMLELNPAFFKDVMTEAPPRHRVADFEERLQQAKDAVIPIRAHQGPVFSIGETIEIRGGLFKVHAISGKRIYLDSIPSR